jgi:hypothetical protein
MKISKMKLIDIESTKDNSLIMAYVEGPGL